MPGTVNHVFTSPIADGTNTQLVRPSNWNSEHLITLNAIGSEISNAFGNAGGVTFGYDGTNVTASAPSGGGGGVAISAGTNSTSTGTVVFANSNGISFGMNTDGVVTGTVATNYQSQGAYLTTARASNDAIGTNTALTAGPLAWTANSAGLSLNAGSAAGTTSGFGGNLISGSMTHNTAGLNLSLNHPAWLTTAMASNAATLSNIRISAGTTSNLASAFTFGDANGVSFGMNAGTITGTVATTYRASNDAIGTNTAQSNVTWTANSAGLSLDARGYVGTATGFSGTNISATMTHNSAGFSLQLSGGGGGVVNQTGPNISAGSDSLFTSGTVTFGNAFGVSFVTSNGSVVASNAFLTTAMASNRGSDFVAATAAFAGTNASGTIASNGISVSVAAGGGAQTVGGCEIFPLGNNSTFTTLGQNSIYLQKFTPQFNVSFNNIERRMSGSSASSAIAVNCNYSIDYGLYSLGTGASTSIYSRISTDRMIIQASYSSNLSAGYTISQGAASRTSSSAGTVVMGDLTGFKHLYLGLANTITVGGQYGIAVRISSATTGNTGAFRIALKDMSMMNNLTIGKVYATTVLATNASFVGDYAQAVYSATSSNLPDTIAISGLTNAISQMRQYIQLEV